MTHDVEWVVKRRLVHSPTLTPMTLKPIRGVLLNHCLQQDMASGPPRYLAESLLSLVGQHLGDLIPLLMKSMSPEIL